MQQKTIKTKQKTNKTNNDTHTHTHTHPHSYIHSFINSLIHSFIHTYIPVPYTPLTLATIVRVLIHEGFVSLKNNNIKIIISNVMNYIIN